METIESKHLHDLKFCGCLSVGVDGGISDGNRILGNPSDMKNRSMYSAIIQKKIIWLPESIIQSSSHIHNRALGS